MQRFFVGLSFSLAFVAQVAIAASGHDSKSDAGHGAPAADAHGKDTHMAAAPSGNHAPKPAHRDAAPEGAICQGFGPQAPRDITSAMGTANRLFPPAPSSDQMNLCNIHLHVNAEHRGPGFSLSGGSGEHGGWVCNDRASLSPAELSDPTNGHGAFGGVHPGDTIEVHWVFSSCSVRPGPGLGSCSSESCVNPVLRVESQVFLLVNDDHAFRMTDFDYAGTHANGLHQPKMLPRGTGRPVLFAGSTTGPSYTEATCSPYQVTWSVRPNCQKMDISSLHAWAERGNVFEEDHAHGVRQIVTAPELLSPIN